MKKKNIMTKEEKVKLIASKLKKSDLKKLIKFVSDLEPQQK